MADLSPRDVAFALALAPTDWRLVLREHDLLWVTGKQPVEGVNDKAVEVARKILDAPKTPSRCELRNEPDDHRKARPAWGYRYTLS